MLKIKELSIGDKVKLQTKEREWQGNVLESYDSEIVLLKLESGYNIGIREEDILNVKVLEKNKEAKKEKVKLQENKKLRNVAMIITGGTISSRLDPKTGGVISTDEEEILNISPKLKEICNIVKVEKPFMKFSENMSFPEWKKVADSAEKLLNNKDIDGLIITQGTDTLHFSSAALTFFLGKLNKSVAITYSQRSIDRGSTDAALNLLCAAKFAVSDIAEVAIIGHKDLEDKYCLAMPGVKVRKLHASRRDAFKVVNSQAFAEISLEEFKILRGFNARTDGKVKADSVYNDKVALIQVYPGQNPEILDYYADKGFKGVILEAFGLGQLPVKDAEYNWIPKIKKLISDGIIVCAAPQTIFGSLNPNVYSTGRELEKIGLIYLRDMLAETAFVKLSWILGHKDWSKSKEKIKEKLLENISGEFNERLGFD
jgi:glutamyl-tRNA(Gln) amidotransferase subunit D